ncbi:MAG: DegT/DnrJ/EryC1/StrS aminotransferase family protein [Elusimicrobiota bacterium]|jgi:dTDP-4-amino-4,6-dideoxygalactose transaminase|nr:DegT/DnrJ/EryC1/StrS aminotransferase family protein [Elusimicrobiota bacterium]
MIYLSSPDITEKEKSAVIEVLNTGIIASGPKVKEFEKRFAEFCNIKYAICVSNGTAALQAGLVASGISKGDRVITTPFTFIATANSILFCGAEIVFCDIDEKSFNLDPNKVEHILKTEKNIKAIMVVHLYGNPADMSDFEFLSKKYNIKIFEDCAQSVGATFDNKITGTFGDFGAFSFYATKNMTTAEGGMVITNSDEIDKKVRSFINHGRSGRFLHNSLGYNFRMTDIQAAIGIVQLERLNGFIEKRNDNAKFLIDKLENINFLTLPIYDKNSRKKRHVFHQFTIRLNSKERDKFVSFMNENGVNVAAIYPVPVHKQTLYQKIKKYSLPIAEKIASQVVSLPVHTKLTQDDLQKIVDMIKRFNK